MYRKLSVEERIKKREEYRQNPIYRILYTPLWRQRGEDLSPEDVWEEANNLAYKLKSITSDNCKIIVAEEFDDLCERYSFFQVENDVVIKRSYAQAEHSAMMVSLVAFLLLANIYPEAKDHPYLKVCQSLTDVASNINGYTEIYEEARAIEDEYESHGEFIEVADFIEQMALRDTPLSSSEIAFSSGKIRSKASRSCWGFSMMLRNSFKRLAFGELGIHSLIYPSLEYLSNRCSLNRVQCSSSVFSG